MSFEDKYEGIGVLYFLINLVMGAGISLLTNNIAYGLLVLGGLSFIEVSFFLFIKYLEGHPE